MKIKTVLLTIALALCATPAFAWDCTYWSQSTNPNAECYKPPVTTGGGGDQSQQQDQTANGGNGTGIGVGIGQGGNAKATGGNATSGSYSEGGSVKNSGNSRNDNKNSSESSSTSGASSNNAVSVDASDRSTTNVQGARINTFIPGDLPTNALVIAPGANLTVAGDQSCGVLATKIQVPVYQWNKRGTKKVQVGYDEDISPVFVNGVQMDYQRVDQPDGGYYLRGSAVTYVLSTYGSSNGSQLGLQGGGGGGYGGVSYGSGRSYSQAGVRLVIRSCIAAVHQATPVVVPKAKPKAKRHYRAKPKTKRHYRAKPKPAAKCYNKTEVACKV